MIIYSRILGMIVVALMTVVVCADRLLMAQGRFEATCLAAVYKLNAAMGHSSWEAGVMYLAPMFIGVLIVFMPQRIWRR